MALDGARAVGPVGKKAWRAFETTYCYLYPILSYYSRRRTTNARKGYSCCGRGFREDRDGLYNQESQAGRDISSVVFSVLYRPPTSLLAMKAVTMAIQYRHGMSAGDEGNTMAWCIRWKMGWSSR